MKNENFSTPRAQSNTSLWRNFLTLPQNYLQTFQRLCKNFQCPYVRQNDQHQKQTQRLSFEKNSETIVFMRLLIWPLFKLSTSAHKTIWYWVLLWQWNELTITNSQIINRNKCLSQFSLTRKSSPYHFYQKRNYYLLIIHSKDLTLKPTPK